MFGEIALGVWSLCGLAWSLTAWRLVAGQSSTAGDEDDFSSVATLTIFKPLPPLGAAGLKPLAAALESFVEQLDATSEILLGVHEADQAEGRRFCEEMAARYPAARLTPVYRSSPDELPNPKVAWQYFLAPRATGELWLWSDADIIAPPGYLRALRREFAAGGARLLTSPYVVRETENGPALLDALFVDVEFFPGVLLLRRLGPVDFGLGAAMFFRRSDFEARVEWRELGRALADDFVLGQKLQPVRISREKVATLAPAMSWREALAHYLRWSKTVQWNRPGGTAARLIVLPVIGWVIAVLLHPFHFPGWLGLLAMMQAEVFFAALILRRLGVKLRASDVLTLEAWGLGRCAVWAACWLPWAVNWRGQRWDGPFFRDATDSRPAQKFFNAPN